MLRSVIAVVVGVLVAVAAIAVLEPLAHRVMTENARAAAAQLAIPAVWFGAAFGAAAAASLIARRWAPAALVVTATILLAALVNSTLFSYSRWIVVGAPAAIALGGVLAIKATKARFGRPPAPKTSDPI